MFPTSASVNTRSIGQCFETCNLLCGQLNLGSLGGLDDVALFRGADDGQRALGDGPGDADLRTRGTVRRWWGVSPQHLRILARNSGDIGKYGL